MLLAGAGVVASSWGKAAARADETSSSLAFAAADKEYHFDTGSLRGTLRAGGASKGLGPVQDIGTGKAIAGAFGVEPVLIREGGSIPVVASFQSLLGLGTLLLGWGQNSDNLHGPNEHFRIADFHRGTRASAHLWHELGVI